MFGFETGREGRKRATSRADSGEPACHREEERKRGEGRRRWQVGSERENERERERKRKDGRCK